jgi:maltooligosyltrehalose trehalohydrolase
VGAELLTRLNCVAQWNDDFHHVLHVLVTGEKDGYYADYADDTIARIGRVLTQGFDYQGETSKVSGHARGEPSAHLPPYAFVSFLQNHDQIGNRAMGERIAALTPPARLRAAYALWLLCPQIPMFFMGEEYAASQPFLYFCDYQGELAEAVREGRRSEFAGFAAFADAQAREKIPDPNAAATFERSRLDWSERDREAHAQHLSDVRRLLHVRAQHIAPRIAAIQPGAASFEVEGARLKLTWPLAQDGCLLLLANLGDLDSRAPTKEVELLYSTVQGAAAPGLAPWEVRLLLAVR